MKYTSKINIIKSLQEVIKKFQDPNGTKHWQLGFISTEPIRGIFGENGSKNKLKYKRGNQEIEMEETIIKNDLPYEFHANYEGKGVYNIQENFFQETLEGNTLWISHNEFRFNGFMKLMGVFMPGSFRNQTYKNMKDFKSYMETNKSIYPAK